MFLSEHLIFLITHLKHKFNKHFKAMDDAVSHLNHSSGNMVHKCQSGLSKDYKEHGLFVNI